MGFLFFKIVPISDRFGINAFSDERCVEEAEGDGGSSQIHANESV